MARAAAGVGRGQPRPCLDAGRSFNSYDKTYGSIGAVVMLLMWFYLSAFIILVGAELNCEVERAARPQQPAPAGQGALPGPPATA